MAINSVQNQREVEEIVPMEKMKMDWVLYIPLENGAALRHLNIERLKKVEYCLPYFYNPLGLKQDDLEQRFSDFYNCLGLKQDDLEQRFSDFYNALKQDDLEESTVVPILYPAEPKPVFCKFDWEFDEIEDFTDRLITDEALSQDQKDAFKEFVEEKVQEAKRENEEAREARKKAVEEMSEETRQAFESMRFYKFYAVKTPDVSNVKAKYINKYYKTAHKVF